MNNTITFFDDEIGAAIWEIAGEASFHYFKTVSEITHLLRQNNNSVKQINCIQNMDVLSDEILYFIKNEYFAKAKISGLRYFAFVTPNSSEGMSSMEIANLGAAEKWDIEIKYFEKKEEAILWLKSM